MNLKFIAIILCVTGIITAMAEPYEVVLTTDPPGAAAYMYLVHPFNVPGNTNYGTEHYYFDCQPTIKNPDWGIKGWDGDDPWLNDNYTSGARKIKANSLNDPGETWVKVAYPRRRKRLMYDCDYKLAWNAADLFHKKYG